MSTTRRINEGLQHQGSGETVYYSLDVSNWGSSPTSVSVKIFSVGTTSYALTDVSTACLTGSASVAGNEISLPGVTALTDGVKYQVETTFTSGGNVLVVPAEIMGER